MHSELWFKEYFSAHDEYLKKLQEYHEAREVWRGESSHDNWERCQEALRRLKRQTVIIERNRKML